jgi:hypothetical protein
MTYYDPKTITGFPEGSPLIILLFNSDELAEGSAPLNLK